MSSSNHAPAASTWRNALLAAMVFAFAAAPTAGQAQPDPTAPPTPAPVAPTAPAPDRKIRVLVIDRQPRWEFRYIKSALLRMKELQVSTILMSEDSDFEHEDGDPAVKLPAEQKDWDAYDVVLMGDVKPGDLTAAQMEQIEKFVKDHGGGFAMIAGEEFAPNAFADTPIARLLPVMIDPNAGKDKMPRKTSFRVQPTDAGRRHPVLAVTSQPGSNDEVLDGLKEVYWHKAIKGVKADGVVLAQRPAAAPDQSPVPLLVAGSFGKGRTYFAGIDETWRWRAVNRENVHARYWRQLVHWLANPDRPRD